MDSWEEWLKKIAEISTNLIQLATAIIVLKTATKVGRKSKKKK